jgi:hypothetical protein
MSFHHLFTSKYLQTSSSSGKNFTSIDLPTCLMDLTYGLQDWCTLWILISILPISSFASKSPSSNGDFLCYVGYFPDMLAAFHGGMSMSPNFHLPSHWLFTPAFLYLVTCHYPLLGGPIKNSCHTSPRQQLSPEATGASSMLLHSFLHKHEVVPGID